jgi:hypothetical protein
VENLNRTRQILLGVLLLSMIAGVASTCGAMGGPPDDSLNRLESTYKTLGLPVPPADASLVRFVTGKETTGAPIYRLGFLLEPAAVSGPFTILSWTEKIQIRSRKRGLVVVEPAPKALDQVRPMGKAAVALAVQCKARGWNDLARKLIESRGEGAEANHEDTLHELAWDYWTDRLLRKGSDRAGIAVRLKALLSCGPMQRDEWYSKLVHSLELALAPSRAQPGSVDAMIDDLLKAPDIAVTGYSLHERDPRYVRLVQAGFDAVPALIAHLDDERLTIGVTTPRSLDTVKEVSARVLADLAGGELAEGEGKAEKADLVAWWEKARKVGEEPYLVAHALPTDPKAEWPHMNGLWVLSKKYPSRLPPIYRSVLDERPGLQSWPIVEAIMAASLPADTKKALLLHATRNKNFEHRRAALWALKDLDRKSFVTELIATLEAVPRTPAEPYWACPEAHLANLVMETDDPRVWKTLEAVARRSDVGMRMELMNPMDYTYIGDRNRKQRLAFLEKFLDDGAVRDARSNEQMFTGPHAGFQFKIIEVRNLAAMEIASILCLEACPEVSWTAERWTELRKTVRRALEAEKKALQPEC